MLVGGPRERWTPSSDGILLLRETQRDMIHQGENRGRGWEFEVGEGESEKNGESGVNMHRPSGVGWRASEELHVAQGAPFGAP